MTPERFAELAEAYGGELRRWPASEQRAAEDLLLEAPYAAAVLARAGALDRALSAFDVPPPPLQLYSRIARQRSGRPAVRLRLAKWLSGLGAAGVLAGGVAAGAAVVSLSGPARADWDGLDKIYEQSSFGVVAGTDDGVLSASDPAREH